MEKLENRLCWWNVDLAKETGTSLEEVEKRERVTGSTHSRCFESIASRMYGEIGKIAVVDVLGHDFPGRLAMLDDGDGSESGGCNVFDQVQAVRPLMRDVKCFWATYGSSHPSTEIRERANSVCAEDTRRC